MLTHCNAGWLATVDWGTATAPIYLAHDRGVPVHVYVDETRPRNQGASLTAFELGQHGVPYTLIADNAGGHLMQHGQVDLCIVGADRVTARGDAANKIGTYLKALAARANDVPFYVAAPHDDRLDDRRRPREIEIEERDPGEVTHIVGRLEDGRIARVALAPPGRRGANPAFDVTPAELVDGIITERGVCPASEAGWRRCSPEARLLRLGLLLRLEGRRRGFCCAACALASRSARLREELSMRRCRSVDCAWASAIWPSTVFN